MLAVPWDDGGWLSPTHVHTWLAPDGLPELDCMAVQLGGHAQQARKGLITKREVQQPVAGAGRPATRIIPGHPLAGCDQRPAG